jgi:hypothetical protein
MGKVFGNGIDPSPAVAPPSTLQLQFANTAFEISNLRFRFEI